MIDKFIEWLPSLPAPEEIILPDGTTAVNLTMVFELQVIQYFIICFLLCIFILGSLDIVKGLLKSVLKM